MNKREQKPAKHAVTDKGYKSEDVEYAITVAKALGWYQHVHKKEYTQEKIAKAMNKNRKSDINKRLITPVLAANITNIDQVRERDKVLLSLSEASKLAEAMERSLAEILYLYEHRDAYEDAYKKDHAGEVSFPYPREIDHKVAQETYDVFLEQDSAAEHESEPNQSVHSVGLLTDPKNPRFSSWFGTYNCYFSSTSSKEAGHVREDDDEEVLTVRKHGQYFPPSKDNIFHGLLKVYTPDEYDDNCCHVELSFISSSSQKAPKLYDGTLALHPSRGTAFFSLRCQSEGEAAYIIVDETNYPYVKAKERCCLGMVLSLSNMPGQRRTCCEKILIISDPIPTDSSAYASMKTHLKMNDSYIRITSWGYDELLGEIENSSDEDLRIIKEIYPTLDSLDGNTVTIESIAHVPESTIHKAKNLTPDQKKKYLFLLRSHSLSSWYFKVNTSNVDDVIKLIDR